MGSDESRDITAGYHGGNRESREAHRLARLNAQTIRARIVAFVADRGEWGATSDEVEIAMQLPHQTVSARLVEAKKRGELLPTGERRRTRFGAVANVLVAAEPDHLCDTCHGRCKGGCEEYESVNGDPRHGCIDYEGCAKAWARLKFGAKQTAANG
jgi:hypothetical protein